MFPPVHHVARSFVETAGTAGAAGAAGAAGGGGGRLRAAGGRLLRSQQLGLALVLLALGAALTAAAGTHPDRVTGAPVNNFLNAYTLIQMATDASAFAIMGVG